jgi:Escherichia/Staphylococcus phage prohead protease
MATKSLPARVKAADDETGIVEALVATYDRDSIGDRIVPGAFEQTLADWAESAKNGAPMPFIWSHRHDDIDAYLGDVIEAAETDDGLQIKAQMDMDDPVARKAYRQIKGGRVRNYSFAYEAESEVDEDSGDNLLTVIKLYEVGPTLIGMNQNTRTLSAKDSPGAVGILNPDQMADYVSYITARYGQKAGRVLSAKNEQDLRAAADLIGGVLATLDKPDDGESSNDDQGKQAQPAAPANDEAPARRKSEEPNQTSAALDDLATEIELQLRS